MIGKATEIYLEFNPMDYADRKTDNEVVKNYIIAQHSRISHFDRFKTDAFEWIIEKLMDNAELYSFKAKIIE